MNDVVLVKSTQLHIRGKDMELVQMAADGVTRREMAERTGKAHRTIEHRFNVMKDMADAKTMAHLIAIFFRKGFIK